MTPAEQHRSDAAAFTTRVRGVRDDQWDGPTPVPEWRVRDVVGHLVEWLPAFLASASDVRLEPGPSAADDPVAAWEHHAAAVQAVLDDPASAALVLSDPRFGGMGVPDAIDNLYSSDVFMHTWDLARATGQDDTLDADRCEAMLAGMAAMEDALRASGQYGSPVAVPDDAPVQDRLMGFIGRDPAWRRGLTS